MYTKKLTARKEGMSTSVDQFETLFAHLECMGLDTKLLESLKAPLLLAGIGNNLPLEGTLASFRT